MSDNIIFKNVSKIYGSGENTTTALNNVSFEIEKGKFTIIVGQSGAGKTTLLNLLGGMDSITDGSIIVGGKDISSFNEKELTTYRRYDVGFVFQFYNLVQNLTAKENIELATEISNSEISAEKALEDVGLLNRKDNFPSQLSGGEQQRVSIARALAKNPKLLLCDEPTGALDYKTGKSILKLLQDICFMNNIPVIVVTHNLALMSMADKIIKVKNGEISDIIINENVKNVEDIEW
ncbi:ABC transporter ATP-binding protein [Anaerofustis stercorihominis]|uniref:ABC transporter, ATP-binding protein n=1 Tax=Anaerofustis stercorihominis DSM 17244 TaxID=445971 RepID=B1CBN7_9FIRM|nr:ABC transporter ATP-binding protein [Anaerofustis stercorihominis]EDS71684.1 ABC transporter, ATP-binding protein [Anaerofustis stercorihominis DSM 17244]